MIHPFLNSLHSIVESAPGNYFMFSVLSLGRDAGAIIGHWEGDGRIEGNTLQDVSVNGACRIGGIAGFVNGGTATISGNTSTNVRYEQSSIDSHYDHFCRKPYDIVNNWQAGEISYQNTVDAVVGYGPNVTISNNN